MPYATGSSLSPSMICTWSTGHTAMRACRALLSSAKSAGSGVGVQGIRDEAIAIFRGIEETLQQWPTSSLPDSQYTQFVRDQIKAVEAAKDEKVLGVLRQQARDMMTMQDNLTRQKDIAMLLSGERAPPRELVRMAAARCGLSVPLTPEEVEARKQKEQQPPSKMWTPDLKGDFAERYGKRIEKRIGPN